MDAGGRATQGAVVERERRIKSIGYPPPHHNLLPQGRRGTYLSTLPFKHLILSLIP